MDGYKQIRRRYLCEAPENISFRFIKTLALGTVRLNGSKNFNCSWRDSNSTIVWQDGCVMRSEKYGLRNVDEIAIKIIKMTINIQSLFY